MPSHSRPNQQAGDHHHQIGLGESSPTRRSAPAPDAAGTGPVRRSIRPAATIVPRPGPFGPRVGRGANRRQTFSTPPRRPAGRTPPSGWVWCRTGGPARSRWRPPRPGPRPARPQPAGRSPRAYAAEVAGIPGPTMAAGHRAPACCGRLSDAPRRRGGSSLARFLAHVRSWQDALPESGGLLQGGRSVKNGSPAVVSGIHRSPRAIAGDAKGRHH